MIHFRFFATGDFYSTIGHSFRVGFSTVSKIVGEVSEAIIKIVGPMFLPGLQQQFGKNHQVVFMKNGNFPTAYVVLTGNT